MQFESEIAHNVVQSRKQMALMITIFDLTIDTKKDDKCSRSSPLKSPAMINSATTLS